ncbi:MAG: response regulator transcription factor [Lachnospirales bacterium]
MRVLVVDDEKLILKGIKFSLIQEQMEVDTASDGDEALELFYENEYDIVILDIMLPKKTGLEVCQIIRETSSVPIIMLTAMDSDMDKILGLDYGADDYITKPFNILELKARIKAILRRSTYGTQRIPIVEEDIDSIEVRGLRLVISSKRVFIDELEVNLTLKEFDILYLMMRNLDKVYSREALLEEIWDKKNNPDDVRTVDVHVRRLREKIEKTPSRPQYIYTKWGVGYYFKK